MQEHEYKTRDNTVRKMSREGLTEQSLHSKTICKIGRREKQSENGTDAAEPENEVPEVIGGQPEEMPRGVTGHSARMEGIRGHPSGSSYAEDAAGVSHNRKKKLVQSY